MADLKLGILDFDTSHVTQFTMRLNHKLVEESQFVLGAKVVVGCAGESKLSPERIPGFTKTMQELGVPLVEKPTDMIGKVDGMLIEAVDGSVHWERVKPFLEAGIPCFIDKPFACSVVEAKKIIDLAEKKKVPIFSSSSLRYAPDIVEYQNNQKKHGTILGASVYSPCALHERNPGLFHYGIHGCEMLFSLMGPGCEMVATAHQKGVDLVTATWKDGRLASFRGIRDGKSGYGFTAFASKSVEQVTVKTDMIYKELLKKIVEFFKTGKSPVPPRETLEIIAFIEAANRSGVNHGSLEMLKI